MRNLTFSFSIVFCLIMLGLSGSAFGQSDSLKQNRDSILDINNKWEQKYDSIRDIINDIKMVNQGTKVFFGQPLSSDSVQILRTQLIAHFEKGELEEVRKIKNLLWERQHFAGENLSYPEYWLILFWIQEYASLLDLKKQAREYSYSTGYGMDYYTYITFQQTELMYESFYPILKEKSRKFHSFLKDQINETAKDKDRFFLAALLHILLKPDSSFLLDNRYIMLRYPESLNAKPSHSGVGIGIYYDKGWYNGEISNYVHNHNTFRFSFDYAYKWIFMQLNLSWWGRFDAGYVNINGDTFRQKFYGESFGEVQILFGYKVLSSSMISIIPNVGTSGKSYDFSTTKGNGIGNIYSQAIKYIRINDFSLGLLVDINLVKFGIRDCHYAALRFKYDYCFGGKRNGLYYGDIHQLATGFVLSFNDIY